MYLNGSSLSIVILGDWSRLYSKPEWIAKNIYEENEIEVAVNGEALNAELKVFCRSGNVVIAPEQQKVTFGVMDISDDTLENLSKYVNNYFIKAKTPSLLAYGLNLDFSDTNTAVFDEVVDAMPDSELLFEDGYSIVSTSVKKVLVKEGKTISVESEIIDRELNVHFNEHHEGEEILNISKECLQAFIEQCKNIVLALGYELEGEDE